ncbi:MAG: hypothetical protein KAS07_01555 [Candidatus Pacebacteria bacterium]|nr:hypothetical protein [Candidatus Paceibacterota bacterium]
MRNKHILPFLLGLIVCILIVNMLALQYHLYWRIFWLDIPMHFLGGFWLGFGALWLYFLSGKFSVVPDKHREPLYVITLAIISAIVFGSLWEAYEFGIDIFISLADVYNMRDTVTDLIMDVFGALVSAAYFIKGKYYSIEEK